MTFGSHDGTVVLLKAPGRLSYRGRQPRRVASGLQSCADRFRYCRRRLLGGCCLVRLGATQPVPKASRNARYSLCGARTGLAARPAGMGPPAAGAERDGSHHGASLAGRCSGRRSTARNPRLAAPGGVEPSRPDAARHRIAAARRSVVAYRPLRRSAGRRSCFGLDRRSRRCRVCRESPALPHPPPRHVGSRFGRLCAAGHRYPGARSCCRVPLSARLPQGRGLARLHHPVSTGRSVAGDRAVKLRLRDRRGNRFSRAARGQSSPLLCRFLLFRLGRYDR